MHKKKCPVCKSVHTVKNGKRKGCQLHKCADCGYRFRGNSLPGEADLWRLYQEGKQTVRELPASLCVSPSTVKRRLRQVSLEWEQPTLWGGGFVHLDASYWGRNWGVMSGVDKQTGRVLYIAFIRSETTADYVAAVESIVRKGYHETTGPTRRVSPVTCLSLVTILFLVELHPCRAPLRFRPQSKDKGHLANGKVTTRQTHPAK